ncbi:MAG: hypothetical protein LRY73_14815 [Bacillus sp. (in: Bacteria)]|nr:hypothetical protein [Bacillus sp. (in: firmicutes)]
MIKWVTPIAVATAAGAYFLAQEERRKQLRDYYNRSKAKLLNRTKEECDPVLQEKVGHSHPHDHEDNTMVDEGAVYSVNYYNKRRA